MPDITAYADSHFKLTRDLTQWAALYTLASARFVGVIRRSPTDADRVYRWDSTGAGPFANGSIAYDAATKWVTLKAPSSDVLRAVGFGGGTFVWEYGFYLPAAPADYIRIEGGPATFLPGSER